MAELNPFTLSNLPEDERAVYAEALVSGQSAGLAYLLERASSYQDLVELELEDNPAAVVYLRDGRAALSQAQTLLGTSDPYPGDAERDFEALDLSSLMHGVTDRISRIELTDASLTMQCENAAVWGNILLLQQAMFQLPCVSIESNKHPTLSVNLNHVSAVPAQRGTDLGEDDREFLTVTCGPQVPEEEFIPLLEYISAHGKFEASRRLLFVFGALRLHSGDLFCSRTRGPETCRAYLPFSRGEGTMSGGESVNEADLGGTETILLVDDEAIIWDVVIDMLQSLGYTVVLAATGKECVDIYADNPGEIDLVLLDMIMPEMNGYDAYFALHKIDPDAKVLLSSGYVAEEDAQDVLAAGAAGFLKKPYRLIDLARKIRQVLS